MKDIWREQRTMTTKLLRSGKIIIYFSLLLYTLYLKLINNIIHSSITFFEEVNVKVNFNLSIQILQVQTIFTSFYILFDKSNFFLRDENAEQSSKTSSSGSMEPKPKDPELEAAKTLTSQLIQHEARNKVILHFSIILHFFYQEKYEKLIKL